MPSGRRKKKSFHYLCVLVTGSIQAGAYKIWTTVGFSWCGARRLGGRISPSHCTVSSGKCYWASQALHWIIEPRISLMAIDISPNSPITASCLRFEFVAKEALDLCSTIRIAIEHIRFCDNGRSRITIHRKVRQSVKAINLLILSPCFPPQKDPSLPDTAFHTNDLTFFRLLPDNFKLTLFQPIDTILIFRASFPPKCQACQVRVRNRLGLAHSEFHREEIT